MQWSINKGGESDVKLIDVFAQTQSVKKTLIGTWTDAKWVLSKNGKNLYGKRLIANFIDNEFTVKIFKVSYSDSGNFSADVILKPVGKATGVATVNVHGMFFSYCH